MKTLSIFVIALALVAVLVGYGLAATPTQWDLAISANPRR